MKEISEEQLWDAAEGRLPESEKAGFEEWLAAGPGNRRRWDTIRRFSGVLQSMETDDPPMRFAARVMEAWDRERALTAVPLQTRTDKRIVLAVAVLLGLLLVLTIGILISTFFPGATMGGGLTGEGLINEFGLGATGLENRFSSVIGSLGNALAASGSYFAGFCLLLVLALAERYLHSRNYIRSIKDTGE